MRLSTTLSLLLAPIQALLAAPNTSPNTNCTPVTDVGLHEHLLEACEPFNATGHRSLDTPCGLEASIQMQCLYQTSPQNASLPDYEFPFRKSPLASNVTQRDCLCQTHIFDAIKGCSACNKAYGGRLGFGWEEEESYDDARSAYCIASSTPTLNFADFMRSALETGHTKTVQETRCSVTSAPSMTAASDYYTPSVPLSIAAHVARLEGNDTSYTSLFTSDGQIVPTPLSGVASATHHGNQKGQDKATSTSTESGGAAPTAGLAAGILGFAVAAAFF